MTDDRHGVGLLAVGVGVGAVIGYAYGVTERQTLIIDLNRSLADRRGGR